MLDGIYERRYRTASKNEGWRTEKIEKTERHTSRRGLESLCREIKAREDSLSDIVTLQEAWKLPCLPAMVKEAFRLAAAHQHG